MSDQNRKGYIEELVTEFCLADEGDCHRRVALFWEANPDVRQEYIAVCGAMSARFLAVRINRELGAAAGNEDEGDANIEQLALPGIPPAPLSPLVEVAPGDWRRDIDVSMEQQISHSARMEEKARRKASYQNRKGRAQFVAAEAMESRDPHLAAMPRGKVIERWKDIGLFDEAEPVETTHQATT